MKSILARGRSFPAALAVALSFSIQAPAAGGEVLPDYIRFAPLPGNPQLGADVGCVRVQGGGIPSPTEKYQALGFTAGPNGIAEGGGGDDVPLGPVAATYSWRLLYHHARYTVPDQSLVGTIDPVTGVFTAGNSLATGYGIVRAVAANGKSVEAPIFVVPPDFVLDPPPRVHHFTCETRGKSVRLEWMAGGSYLKQSVYRDGKLIAELPGEATSHDDPSAEPGIHQYEVVGSARILVKGEEREVDSDPTRCVTLVRRPPTVHLLWSPAEQVGGRTDSVRAVREALEANGEEVFQVQEIVGVNLRDFRAVWAIFGTYPKEHYFWLSETVQLAKYLKEEGGKLYIEGSDIWGAVPVNAFHEVDGVFHCPPDDIFCVGIDPGKLDDLHSIRGADAGNGLDLTPFAGPVPYTGENDFVDHLQPGPPGAGTIWHSADAGKEFAVGIAYAGPGYRMIECSFEFGGIEADRVEILRRYLEFLDAGSWNLYFVRGDADMTRKLDVSDAIRILSYLFLGLDLPDCLDAADTNDDGAVDITDGIAVLSYLFLGADPPVQPFPDCGLDPTEDPSACLTHLDGCP